MSLLESDSLVEYGARRVIITITVIFCALLEVVDTTIVNVALNEMGGNLGCTTAEVSWVITAYAIGNVIVMPMTSWLSQQFGRRNYFAASIILFTICSFLCGNATSINELILFRLLQGIGGGALLVTSQTIITESFPLADRGMAQAIYGLGVIVGPTLGPPLGGYIVDNYSWPYIFYINIPIGIIAAILTIQFVKSPKYAEKTAAKDIDWWGIIFLAIGIGSLQYVLEKGQEEDWFTSESIVICTVLAVFGFFFFIWRESVCKNPIVSFKVLRNFNLKIGTILSFILGFGLFGSTFIVPLYTQSILGWTATQAGLLMVPASLATAFMMPIMGATLKKGFPAQYLVAIGMFLFFIYSFWAYSILSPYTSGDDFFWVLVIRGVGLALLFMPITNLSLSGLKGQEIGQGAAFTGLMRQLGGSFGIAIINTFIVRKSVQHRSDVVSHLSVDGGKAMDRVHQIQQGFAAKGFSTEEALAKGYKLMDLGITKQAMVLSYMDAFLYLGILFLICVPFVLILLRKNKGANVDLSSAH
ncbi:MAG: DHA2 family efflux MFS transporter permease subunit [Sporocytophaga sp.]|uniref:DHA2 family efflux MFS transporter permease subunit n=1 Tax=Sporocytophaga sp. TaxID=2231183 RepID=UPI001B2BCE8A|nr:DHA2 family efflux MFS transporter permease subunit [Sporocytophaga sp.]MBO9702864.1 DHA2 family efflux MFS transporter permease subunit [Sporocytophaga sp.]